MSLVNYVRRKSQAKSYKNGKVGSFTIIKNMIPHLYPQRYRNTKATVASHGKLDLFIAFTTNHDGGKFEINLNMNRSLNTG